MGYKVHLTETCEANELHLVTHVETTPSVLQDVSTTEAIHQALADKACTPEKHLVDVLQNYQKAEFIRDLCNNRKSDNPQ
jgi:hypothetical protein